MKTQTDRSRRDGIKPALQKTWIALARKEGTEKITVQKLCQKTPVSRSSFYAAFSNLKDLEEWIEEAFFAGLQAGSLTGTFYKTNLRKKTPDEYQHFFCRLLGYLKQNQDLLELLLIEQPDPAFTDRWSLLIDHHLCLRYPNCLPGSGSSFLRQSLPSILLDLYRTWLTDPALEAASCAKTITEMVFSLDSLLKKPV